jgi:hypothetical protein
MSGHLGLGLPLRRRSGRRGSRRRAHGARLPPDGSGRDRARRERRCRRPLEHRAVGYPMPARKLLTHPSSPAGLPDLPVAKERVNPERAPPEPIASDDRRSCAGHRRRTAPRRLSAARSPARSPGTCRTRAPYLRRHLRRSRTACWRRASGRPSRCGSVRSGRSRDQAPTAARMPQRPRGVRTRRLLRRPRPVRHRENQHGTPFGLGSRSLHGLVATDRRTGRAPRKRRRRTPEGGQAPPTKSRFPADPPPAMRCGLPGRTIRVTTSPRNRHRRPNGGYPPPSGGSPRGLM